MRAIENDRWILSATDTGVTASIDPYGRTVARLAAKGASGAGCAVCPHFRNHVLHAARGLVRVAVCDNFSRGAAHALRFPGNPQESRSILMNQEFEQEYGSLSKKVRELREYL